MLAKKGAEADKTALIAIDQAGNHLADVSYKQLDRSSSRFADALLGLGVAKNDNVAVILPRISEWYHVLFGCAQMGAVAILGTNLLTANDIEYRISRAGAKVAVVSEAHADAVEAIKAKCPTLEHLILVRMNSNGWHSFDTLCAQSDDHFDRTMVGPTRSTDLILIYFTPDSTAMPKMVGRDHAYALSHSITKSYWQDLSEDDIHWTLTDTGWAKGAWGLLYPQLLAGCAIVLYDEECFDLEIHFKHYQNLSS